MNNSHQKIWDELDKINNVAGYLRRVANAHYHLGNDRMGEDMELTANNLLKSSEAIRQAVGEWINNYYQEAQQSFYGTLASVLERLPEGDKDD